MTDGNAHTSEAIFRLSRALPLLALGLHAHHHATTTSRHAGLFIELGARHAPRARR